jgi:hypothetical protein
MKRTTFVLCFAMLASVATFAQDNKGGRSYVLPISKEIQRMQFQNARPAVLVAGNYVNLSKSIHQVSASRRPVGSTRIDLSGTPPHVISKGVARMQYERKSKAE